MKKDIGIAIKRVKRVNTARTGSKSKQRRARRMGNAAHGLEHLDAAGIGHTDRPRVRRPLSSQINIITIMLS